MQVVIPLAGPDFDLPDGGVKAAIEIEDRPLLRRALEERIWWRRGQACDRDLVFVLKESPASRSFAEQRLTAWYPRARSVFLSDVTSGAALSALAGVALARDAAEPVCIDLVDIEYRSTFDPIAEFAGRSELGAAALTFSSQNAIYSYLRTDGEGRVVEAAEKRVISSRASAGTYFFASAAVYLAALAHNLASPAAVTHRGLFFVCPVLNGVIANGLEVALSDVDEVRDIKCDGGGLEGPSGNSERAGSRGDRV